MITLKIFYYHKHVKIYRIRHKSSPLHNRYNTENNILQRKLITKENCLQRNKTVYHSGVFFSIEMSFVVTSVHISKHVQIYVGKSLCINNDVLLYK